MKYQMEEPWALYFLHVLTNYLLTDEAQQAGWAFCHSKDDMVEDSRTSRRRSWRNWSGALYLAWDDVPRDPHRDGTCVWKPRSFEEGTKNRSACLWLRRRSASTQ